VVSFHEYRVKQGLPRVNLAAPRAPATPAAAAARRGPSPPCAAVMLHVSTLLVALCFVLPPWLLQPPMLRLAAPAPRTTALPYPTTLGAWAAATTQRECPGHTVFSHAGRMV